MKCFRSIIILLVLVSCSLAHAQSKAEAALLEQLDKDGKESVDALDAVLKNAKSTSSVVLYVASGIAMREQRLEDSGFLFYIARFRAHYDAELYPPVGTGGDSPMTLIAALQSQMGSAITPALMAEPKKLAKALKRLKAWAPEVTSSYQPGWEFKAGGDAKKAEAWLNENRGIFLRSMTDLSTLLLDSKYFAAFKIVRDFNLGANPSLKQEDFDGAMKTMESIEAKRGLEGFAAQFKPRKKS